MFNLTGVIYAMMQPRLSTVVLKVAQVILSCSLMKNARKMPKNHLQNNQQLILLIAPDFGHFF
jgi:hypothetical protein